MSKLYRLEFIGAKLQEWASGAALKTRKIEGNTATATTAIFANLQNIRRTFMAAV